MGAPFVRPATVADVATLERIVDESYRHYIPRIGKPPGPMLDDYAARVAEGSVSVLEDGEGGIAGFVVLLPETTDLTLLNIAVAPSHQGQGFGRLLLEFTEREATERGLAEVRLYTHEKMTENIEIYRKAGYVETGRVHEEGYDRVYMVKRLG